MKKLLALLLTALAISANADKITQQEFARLFKNYNSFFILYNANKHKIVSEYKIPTIIAINELQPIPPSK